MPSSELGDRFFALVPCAGTGSRAGAAQPKQYQPLAGQPLVWHTLTALAAVRRLARLLVLVAPGDTRLQALDGGWEVLACGGATRAQTVLNGLEQLHQMGVRERDWVLVHDAARCLVTPAQVDALIDACQDDAVGGLLALPVPDTIKAEHGRRVQRTVEREGLWLAQTPQMFRLGVLRAALKAQAAQGFVGITDEASAIEAAGGQPLLVQGSAHNLKVTYPEDFALAETALKGRLA